MNNISLVETDQIDRKIQIVIRQTDYTEDKAREKLKEKIIEQTVYLKNVKLDKYGRLLADVYHNNICLNEWLLQERLAVKYDGKTKNIPKSWKRYYLDGDCENSV